MWPCLSSYPRRLGSTGDIQPLSGRLTTLLPRDSADNWELRRRSSDDATIETPLLATPWVSQPSSTRLQHSRMEINGKSAAEGRRPARKTPPTEPHSRET